MKKIGTRITVEASPLRLPTKSYEEDAAYNLFTDEKVEAAPHTRVYISLGFKIALPPNMALLIQPRSGQSGKGMIAYAEAPKWLGGDSYKIRINADSVIGLIDSNYGKDVKAIVKFGRFRWKHRIMRMLGFKIYIDSGSCVCQGRFVYVPNVNLIRGIVKGSRDGLGQQTSKRMDEQYILRKIGELMPDDHHKPRGVLYSQLKTAVQQDLSALMKQLFGEKKIEAHKTLNDILLISKH